MVKTVLGKNNKFLNSQKFLMIRIVCFQTSYISRSTQTKGEH